MPASVTHQKELIIERNCGGFKLARKLRLNVLVDQFYEIEHDLIFWVLEAIANLSVAGFSIWLLKGDKVEMAINIERSCRLLSPKMNREDGSLYVMDPDEKMEEDKCEQHVHEALAEA